MNIEGNIVTVSGILLGFLFTGFWWILNREIHFNHDERHFKLCYWLIFLAMAILAVFGVIIPLYSLSVASGQGYFCFIAISIALVLIFGYMLAELGHYDVFQKPKYVTHSEKIVFIVTITIAVTVMALLLICWP